MATTQQRTLLSTQYSALSTLPGAALLPPVRVGLCLHPAEHDRLRRLPARAGRLCLPDLAAKLSPERRFDLGGLPELLDAFTTQSGVFKEALNNTLFYTVFTVTVNIFVGLILASLIQPLGKYAQTFFRAAFYLPAVTAR